MAGTRYMIYAVEKLERIYQNDNKFLMQYFLKVLYTEIRQFGQLTVFLPNGGTIYPVIFICHPYHFKISQRNIQSPFIRNEGEKF